VIPILKPLFQGQLAALGERLDLTPELPSGTVRISDLIESEALLTDALQRHAGFWHSDGVDMRPIASAWALQYAGILLPPAAAAASVLQHEFPMAADEVWVRLDQSGNPIRFHIRQPGTTRRGASTALRYEALLDRHLAPLFDALARLTRVSRKILWGSVSRNLEPVLEQAIALTGGSPALEQDRHHLLCSPTWPLDGAAPRTNPLFGTRRVVQRLRDGREMSIRLHRQCCLYHLLPAEGYCGACPLDPAHRKRAPDAMGAAADVPEA